MMRTRQFARRVTIIHASSSTDAFVRSTRLVRAETHRKDLGHRFSPVLAPFVVVVVVVVDA